MTKMPRLLTSDLTEVCPINVISQSVELQMTSMPTASITLDDASGIEMRSFVRVYTHKGSAGVFRVAGKETMYGGDASRVELEHGITVLGDALVPGEGKKKGTITEILSFLLGYQTAKIGSTAMWTLGTVAATKTLEYAYDNTNVYSAILDVMDKLPTHRLEYDQSAFPWVLSVVAVDTQPSCECRLSRNVSSARVTLDDEELTTRVYCSRLEGGYMQLEDNPRYGIIARSIEASEEVAIEEVQSTIRQYLQERSEPMISVEIDAQELSEITGEPLDSFGIGRVLRLALPEYGITLNEVIVSISYEAAIEKPEAVRLTLANLVSDVSSRLAGLIIGNKQGERMFQRVKTIEKQVFAYNETAERFYELDEKLHWWFGEVGIDLDAETASVGIFATSRDLTAVSDRVARAELILDGDEGVAGLVARVENNERNLFSVTNRVTSAELILNGNDATAGLVARVTENEEEISAAMLLLNGEEGSIGLISKTDQAYNTLFLTRDGLLSTISRDGLISTINQTAEEVTITASKINLSGYVTATQLESELAEFEYTMTDALTVRTLNTTGSATISGELSANSLSVYDDVRVNGKSYSLQNVTVLLGTSTIEVVASGGVVTGVNFNKKPATLHYLGYE